MEQKGMSSYIMRVDCARRQVSTQVLDRSDVLLGGRGMTSKLIHREVDPTCHALGDKNKLIFSCGPLAGTNFPSSARLSVGGKSPLTQGIKESNSGGLAAHYMGLMGLRALVLEGLPNPEQTAWSILVVDGKTARFEAADDLNGLDLSQKAGILYEKYGKKIGLALIGAAGEHRYSLAGIAVNDLDGVPSRYCGRGGMGALLGVRRLHGVVFRSKDKPQYHDRKKFSAALKQAGRLFKESPVIKAYQDYGTVALVNVTNALGALPTRNFSTGSFEDADRISGETMRATILERKGEGKTTHPCMPGCIIQCSNIFADKAGKEVVRPMEYENVGLLGSNLGIGDLDQIAQLNRLCNEYGVDTIETGAAIGVLMKAGVLEFGDYEGAMTLLEEIKAGTIMGRILGAGTKTAGEVFGVYEVPVVKGQALPAYDPRAVPGLAVTYSTTPMGGDHTAGNCIRSNDQPDAAAFIEDSRQKQRMAGIYDCMGLCVFCGAVLTPNLTIVAEAVNARYGTDVTADEIRSMVLETLSREREFNRKAGIGPVQDRLPEFFYTRENPACGSVCEIEPGAMQAVWADIEGK